MPLLDRYEQALAAQSRADDPAQRLAARRLDALDQCLNGSPGPGAWRRHLAPVLGMPGHPSSCRGLYLWGPVGRGKTWLMDLFHSGRPASECRRAHFAHFMREVHARRRGLGGVERPLDRVAAQLARVARVWCLDEFMVQDIGDAMILHGILDGLLKRNVIMVITSNTAPARLYANGLQRERFLPAIALLTRHLDVLEIAPGTDYRRLALQSTPVWLSSADPQSGSRLTDLFRRLAGDNATDHAATMMVEDRPIQARCHAGAMAWFAFDALCDGPRSADDYIAIARSLHTVFVSGVPVFDGSNDDAARRFIALIDELYDQRVKLVVSAAAEPFELYRGERLRADFERTSSRLIEMRGSGYLGAETRPAGQEP